MAHRSVREIGFLEGVTLAGAYGDSVAVVPSRVGRGGKVVGSESVECGLTGG